MHIGTSKQSNTYNRTHLTDRGYTGHGLSRNFFGKHLPCFNFISITCPGQETGNGLVYDPLLGLFLSPDPYIQEPHNPSNYNRYSYVLNNPLKYTDPSGYKKTNRRAEPPLNTFWDHSGYSGSGGKPAAFTNKHPSQQWGTLDGPANNFDYDKLLADYYDMQDGYKPGDAGSANNRFLSMFNAGFYSMRELLGSNYVSASFSYRTENSYSPSNTTTYQYFNGSWTYMIGSVNSKVADPVWTLSWRSPYSSNSASSQGEPILLKPLENLSPEYIGGYPLVGGYVSQIPKLAKYVISSASALVLIKYYQKNPVYPTPHYTERGKQDKPFLNNNNNDTMIDPASPSIAFSLGLLDMYITWKDATNPDIDNSFTPDSTKRQIDFLYFNEQ